MVKMTQNLKNKLEKMKESINTFNKDLKGIKNKQRQTTHLLKLKYPVAAAAAAKSLQLCPTL